MSEKEKTEKKATMSSCIGCGELFPLLDGEDQLVDGYCENCWKKWNEPGHLECDEARRAQERLEVREAEEGSRVKAQEARAAEAAGLNLARLKEEQAKAIEAKAEQQAKATEAKAEQQAKAIEAKAEEQAKAIEAKAEQQRAREAEQQRAKENAEREAAYAREAEKLRTLLLRADEEELQLEEAADITVCIKCGVTEDTLWDGWCAHCCSDWDIEQDSTYDVPSARRVRLQGPSRQTQ